MRTSLSLLVVVFFSNLLIAQTTAIPDINFERALIRRGYDVGTPDGKILTAGLGDRNIKSLVGIEDFTSLTILKLSNVQLTFLIISKNTALIRLELPSGKLRTLDVSKNTALTNLVCGGNQLTSLDVSRNLALTQLLCFNNQLTSLDVSRNAALTDLLCADNLITSLNVSKHSIKSFTML